MINSSKYIILIRLVIRYIVTVFSIIFNSTCSNLMYIIPDITSRLRHCHCRSLYNNKQKHKKKKEKRKAAKFSDDFTNTPNLNHQIRVDLSKVLNH